MRTGSIITLSALCFFLPVILASAASKEGVQRIPEYNLSVSFDTGKNLLKGLAKVDRDDREKRIFYSAGLTILSVEIDGRPVKYKTVPEGIEISGKGAVEIRYEGTFSGDSPGKKDHGQVGIADKGVVSSQGISLTENWYPSPEGPAYYHLTALVPAGFSAVSEADEITFQDRPSGREYSFHFPHPLNGITCVAAKYREKKDSVAGIDVYTYFFDEDAGLADRYLEQSKKYLAMYGAMLVPYPYKRFSVVENILPTGVSMPTYTLLGRAVVRLPFIPETSLGHEITHQWFGNLVYGGAEGGNWLEAITTYLADQYYEELKGSGWEYRKKIMMDYQSYVNPQNEFPLKDFTERKDSASMAIGYGKGAMVFHMLRKLVGDEMFYGALRKLIAENEFRSASWTDVRLALERESGRELGWFFSQWLDRKGVPEIAVQDARDLVLNGVPKASFELVQKKEPYRTVFPLRITGRGGDKDFRVDLGKDREYFEMEAAEKPREIVFDGDYDVMRTLSRTEFPPVLSRLFGDAKKILTFAAQDKEEYAGLISEMSEQGFTAKEVLSLKDDDIMNNSLLIVGADNPALKRLFGKVENPGPGFSIIVRENPLNTSKVVAYASAGSKEEVALAAGKLVHYGKYSVLRFEKGTNIEKATAKSQKGMVFGIHEKVEGVQPAQSVELNDIIDKVAGMRAIFIGERHTNYEDHKVELDVVSGLHERGKKIAIGMEMFQRPFQKIVDDYVSGAIDEREFLKKSEYFLRWRFDYSLYRELIEFARAKRIPIVALNQKSEIVEKVAAGGLDSLSESEKKDIPADMDMADETYRERLREIYESHPRGPKFDNFYQSQILWDETMAHSAADFVKGHPDAQIVVIAGAEHVMYGSGIPGRFRRITGEAYASLVNGVFDQGIATYVLYPQELNPPFTAKIGAVLKEKNGEVFIESFSPGSLAEKAGLRKNDRIASIDGQKITDPADARIALYDKRPGQAAVIKAVRKKFLFGEKEVRVEIQF